MTVYNVTFFYPADLTAHVHKWIADSWMPVASRLGSRPPLALSMEKAPEDEADRLAVQTYFRDREAAEAFAAREAALLIDDLMDRFGANRVLVYPTMMTRVDL